MIYQVCLNDALLEGAQEVFTTMISGNIETCESDQEIEGDSLLGSITFRGGLEGCLGICCSISGAKNIAAHMLAMDPSEEMAEEEICDAFGEVTNMIMGSVKTRIQDTTGEITISIPTVVKGRGLKNSLGEGAQKIEAKIKYENEYITELSMLYRDTSE
ncbi:MAG: chemotaxis protein CheX [Sedimentisphaerales bacterium]|nr:chemotaxis protein CheX [Sedimentisphaerales bacterium]